MKRLKLADVAEQPSEFTFNEDDITFSEEVITPQLAELYLARNYKDNRNVVPRVVARYADDMRRGMWRPIGDPVRFNVDGQLIDGQHRLLALIAAKMTLRFPVVRGLAVSDIGVIDTGKARRPSDALKIAGYTHSALRSAACRVLLVLKEGPITQKIVRSVSHGEILDIAKRHPLLEESANRMKHVRGIKPSALMAIHYIGSHLLGKAEEADAFVQVFATGIPAYAGDAAHMYREKIIHHRQKALRPTEMQSIKEMVYSWNCFSKGRILQIFRPPEVVEFEGLDVDLL